MGWDRTWRNPDGEIFYGHDDGEGRTDWYRDDGTLDSSTSTPTDWEQEMNDDGY